MFHQDTSKMTFKLLEMTHYFCLTIVFPDMEIQGLPK